MKLITWIATCIFASASIACADDKVVQQHIEQAFAYVNQLVINGAQAEVATALKNELRQAAKELEPKPTPTPEPKK